MLHLMFTLSVFYRLMIQKGVIGTLYHGNSLNKSLLKNSVNRLHILPIMHLYICYGIVIKSIIWEKGKKEHLSTDMKTQHIKRKTSIIRVDGDGNSVYEKSTFRLMKLAPGMPILWQILWTSIDQCQSSWDIVVKAITHVVYDELLLLP